MCTTIHRLGGYIYFFHAGISCHLRPGEVVCHLELDTCCLKFAQKRREAFTAAMSLRSQTFVPGIDLFMLQVPLYLGRSLCCSSAP